MRVAFGTIITEGHGKVGGQIIQDSYGGYQLRNIVQPLQQPKYRQSTNRIQFKTLTAQWRLLTNMQRGTWNAAADPGQSGFELFVKTNMPLRVSGLPILSSYVAPVSTIVTDAYLFDVAYEDGILGKTVTVTIASDDGSLPLTDWVPYFLWSGWIRNSQNRYPPMKSRIPIASFIILDEFNWFMIFGGGISFANAPVEEFDKCKFTWGWLNQNTGQIVSGITDSLIATSYTP